ncbi:13927_t:CDS:1, partial [Funneliformis mosseae]
ITLRQESDHLDASDNYAISDTKLEKSSSKSENLKFQIQAFLPVFQPDLKKFQTMNIDLLLAEIDAMLVEI